MERHSFQRGLNEVKRGDVPAVKKEIMAALEITTKAAYHRRLNGAVIHNVDEKEAIEAIFVKYGVRKSKIWGTTQRVPTYEAQR